MRQHLAALALSLAAAAATARAADFEGVIDTRMTFTSQRAGGAGSGTMRVFVGPAGTRLELRFATPGGEIKTTMLQLKAGGGTSYLVDEAGKRYAELQDHREATAEGKDAQFTVQALPGERVAGYDCTHGLVTDDKGRKTEVWTSKAFGGAEAFWAAQGSREQREGVGFKAMAKKLREAGLDGWPLKVRSFPKEGQEVVWEATSIERKAVPASLLSVAGYTKVEPSELAMSQFKLSPEQQQEMEAAMRQQQGAIQEAMKKLSPEQRKQLEEQMKGLPQGGAPGR